MVRKFSSLGSCSDLLFQSATMLVLPFLLNVYLQNFQNVYPIRFLVLIVVMFVMLQVRSHIQQKEQKQSALDLQQSKLQIESEKRHRKEQSQLFSMLAHEMKTPLATLRLWMDMGQLKPEIMQRTIADMNQVIERCVQSGQLADQGLQPDWQSLDPIALTKECVQSC